jgi:dTDP-4-dehydrorhamnose reductase
VVGTALNRPARGLVSFDMERSPLRAAVPDLGPGDVVFLLAGHISPGWIFSNPGAARALNVDASRRLADEAFAAGTRLVFMSTDQVFDGETGSYDEHSAPRPLNLYGRLKVEMESHVLGAPGGIVARTGWNVGWEPGRHCAVAQCYEALLKSGARMAGDNIINITDVDDTARGLVALAGMAPPTHSIYHLVSSPGVARADLAAAVKAASHRGPLMQYQVVPFATLPYTEPRPVRAYLSSVHLGSLGVAFAQPLDVIRRKVAALDSWYAATLSRPMQSVRMTP